jgi:hypothetical protein
MVPDFARESREVSVCHLASGASVQTMPGCMDLDVRVEEATELYSFGASFRPAFKPSAEYDTIVDDFDSAEASRLFERLEAQDPGVRFLDTCSGFLLNVLVGTWSRLSNV